MTQFSMGDIAHIGLLKMDFLGLANLTLLGKAKEIISQENGVDIDLHNIPADDAKAFALLASGETTGVFQLEGAGMRRYIKELKPTAFSDIAAMVALYRPGPMEHIPTFINAKHGIEPVRYPHPALAKILGNSLVDENRQRIRHELFAPARRDELIQALLAPAPDIATSVQAVACESEQLDEQNEGDFALETLPWSWTKHHQHE